MRKSRLELKLQLPSIKWK